MDDLITRALAGMGFTGAVIAVLLSTVGVLSGAIVVMWRKANDVTSSRLKERETFVSTITDTNHTLRGMLTAMQERNDVTEDLAKAMTAQSSQSHLWSEKIKMQYEVMREDHARMATVVGSLSDAVRTISQTTAETKNALPHMSGELRTIIAANLASFLQDVRTILNKTTGEISDELRRANKLWHGD